MVSQDRLLAAMEVASDLDLDTSMRRLVRSAQTLTRAESVELQLAGTGDGGKSITATAASPSR